MNRNKPVKLPEVFTTQWEKEFRKAFSSPRFSYKAPKVEEVDRASARLKGTKKAIYLQAVMFGTANESVN